MNLILLEAEELTDGGEATLSGARAAHLVRVLQAQPGQQVRVGVADGARGVGTVASIDGETVRLVCTFETAVPEQPPVDLLLALPRPKVMRRLWAQVAALGVGRIMLTNAARVERDYFDSHILSPQGYRPLLVEGLQQARDTRLPVVSVHKRFRILVEDELDALSPPGLRLVADPSAGIRVSEAIASRPERRALLAVGPEGGWNAFEIDLLRARGFQLVGMGERALRVDTATVALVALVHAALATAAESALNR